jgi:iron complex outermembrane receptor protein
MKNPRFSGGARMAERSLISIVAWIAMLTGMALPAWPQQKAADLTSQSLEDLMNVPVISVSRTEQKMSRTAAAIFVITQEDIRRSGATNIPDLLRMVPGVEGHKSTRIPGRLALEDSTRGSATNCS